MPILTPPGRTNSTVLLTNHPGDHNAIVDAINTLGDEVDAVKAASTFRTYDAIANRDVDFTAHVDGMLTWAASERIMAVWNGEWTILEEPFIPFTPRLWIGSSEFAPLSVSGYASGYRHQFGACHFYIAQRFGELGPVGLGTDNLYIMPPVPPSTDGRGPFGSAYVVNLASPGQIGGAGVFDGLVSPALPGATVQGHLSISMPGFGGLLRRSDMADSGNFDVFWSGFYPTDEFSE